MTDNTLSGYYASLAQVEGKIAEQEVTVQRAKENLAAAAHLLDDYKRDRRILHAAIRAKKARAKPAAAPAGNADPAMPAHLRRGS